MNTTHHSGFRVAVVFAGLLLVGGAQAQQAAPVPPSQAATPEVLQAIRDAAQRFEQRGAEYENVLSELLDGRLRQQVGELEAEYSAKVMATFAEERKVREAGIAAHEAFIARYPSGALTPQRMLHLSQMYFDQTRDEFLDQNIRYREDAARFDAGETDVPPQEPVRDHSRAIALLGQIIERFPAYEQLDAAYYLLGYCYFEPTSRQRDAEKAFETYKALVDGRPGSKVVQSAYLRLGEILFEDNKFADSIPYYLKVLDHAQNDDYELGLYKLAWAYFKVSDLDKAIPRLVEVLDLSAAREKEGGQAIDLKPEALRYLAISLVDQAEDRTTETMAHAHRFLKALGTRSYEYEVLQQVALVLVQQARFDEAIVAYRGMQQLYPLSPNNPEIHNTLIGLHMKLVPADLEGAAKARAELTELYKPGSSWYEANAGNREALQVATRLIEESLESVAVDYHARAQKTNLPEDFLLAATKYREYLTRFPYAKNAAELRWQLGESLYFGGYFAEAIKEYQIVLSSPDNKYRKDAFYAVVASYEKLIKQKQGDYRKLPGSAESLPLPPDGKKVDFQVLPLTDLDQQFVASIDQLEKEIPDRPELPELLYVAGEIFYYHNQFEEARNRFNRVIEKYPSRDEAGYAASLIVNTYQYEGDLTRLREVSGLLAKRELGGDKQKSQARRELFEGKERNAYFTEAVKLFDGGEHRKAADMFYEYYTRYPNATQLDLALYNAASGYEKLGEVDRARKLYEEMLAKYPSSEYAPETFFQVADAYERVLDLDKAISYYEQLVRIHGKNPRAADSLANAAFLYSGLKRFADAAKAYERYERDYGTQADAGSLLFRAGLQWEIARQPKEALRVFQRFLEKYGGQDPSVALDAQIHIADLNEKLGNSKQARAERQRIVDIYIKEQSRNPGKLDAAAVNAAAKARFSFIQEQFAAVDAIKFTGINAKDEKILVQRSEATKAFQVTLDEFINGYPDFEWITAALYFKGYAFQAFTEAIYAAPIPKTLKGEEEVDAYKEVLAQMAEPIETKAIEVFERVVKEATDRKKNTVWVDKAREALNAVKPDAYPVFKNEELKMKPSEHRPMPTPAGGQAYNGHGLPFPSVGLRDVAQEEQR